MEIRNYWVDIENSAGLKQGAGPLRPIFFEVSSLLSASGEFSFSVSSADPNLSALVEKRVAICRYIDRAGAAQAFGGGVIDQIRRTVQADGSMTVDVSGNDLGRELNYRSVGALDLSGVAAAGVTNGPVQIMALAPAGWTLVGGTTATAIYAGFDGESCLNGLTRITKTIGEHWRIEAGRIVRWLGAATTFAASGVRAVQHVNDPQAMEALTAEAVITGLREVSEAAELITRIIPRGSGNGGAITTLKYATASAPAGYTLSTANNYVKNDAAETAYGQIERAINFKDLGPLSNTTADIQAAANMLLTAAVEYLRQNKAPQKFYEVDLGFVGQMLLPGKTIRVVYRQLLDGVVAYDLDGTYNIVGTKNRIDGSGLHTTGITISTIDRLPNTDGGFLASQVQESRIQSVHQQLGAMVDTLTWRDEMDADHAANFRFWLGDEYTSISRAVLRFKIQSLRSTVKSVAAASATSSIAADHIHSIAILNSIYGTPVNYEDGYLKCSGGGGITTSTDDPAHSHTVTPTITTTYGIFEETSGNTLGLADLAIKLNGGSDLAAGVSDIGNGWYELDITDALTDAVFRPSQENNLIEISTGTAKTARIEAQLTIRAVVQAVYYE